MLRHWATAMSNFLLKFWHFSFIYFWQKVFLVKIACAKVTLNVIFNDCYILRHLGIKFIKIALASLKFFDVVHAGFSFFFFLRILVSVYLLHFQVFFSCHVPHKFFICKQFVLWLICDDIATILKCWHRSLLSSIEANLIETLHCACAHIFFFFCAALNGMVRASRA